MSYPMEPTLRQMAALLAAIETGSLRRAGALLGLGQPALSAQIAALEGKIGQPLLERRNTGVAATAEGRAVAALARDALDAVQRIADRRAGPGAGGRPGDRPIVLNFGISASVGPYILPYALPILRDSAPGLTLRVREEVTAALAVALREGRYDLILTQAPIREQGLTSLPVFEEPVVLMMPADHPLAREQRVAPEKLKGEVLLTLGPGYALARQVESLAADFGAVVSDAYVGSSMDALRMMCALGQGIALVPELYALSEARLDDRVVTRAVQGRRMARMMALAWRVSQGTPPEAAIMAAALTRAAAERRA